MSELDNLLNEIDLIRYRLDTIPDMLRTQIYFSPGNESKEELCDKIHTFATCIELLVKELDAQIDKANAYCNEIVGCNNSANS